MPAKKRPTPQDTVTARQILLAGLARDNGIGELITELTPLHPRHDTFPGEVFLRLGADVLDWCGASQGGAVPLEGIRERFLPECTFRGRERGKLRFAVLAAAAGPRRSRARPAGGGRVVADRRLLAIRLVRSGRLYPCHR
jgi:hypothetical protein